MTLDEYTLICLSEECDEVSHRIAKALRFGLDETQRDQVLSNRQRISIELSDLFTLARIAAERGLLPTVPSAVISGRVEDKKEKLRRYINYSIQLGILEPTNDRRGFL